MSPPSSNVKQISLDFEYDDRVVKLATSMGIMIAPHLAPGVSKELIANLTARMAWQAERLLNKFAEPAEPLRCHTCDTLVGPKERARVVVCIHCGLTGGSPGSDG